MNLNKALLALAMGYALTNLESARAEKDTTPDHDDEPTPSTGTAPGESA